jgi:hypothetical protein
MNAVIRRQASWVEVDLPLRTVSESNARGHWSARHKRARVQRSVVCMRLSGIGREMGLPVVVTLTRVAPSSGLDDDNLRGALKACRDGVADAFGRNDRDPAIRWEYAQERGGRRQYGVRIRIEAAS